MGALSRGEARRENLMKLLDLAAGYEQSGYKGLFGFLNLIRRLMENGFEPFEKKEAIPVDAVKIMSIHKSKGLEFPVVILADTAKRFNNRDASKHLLFHAQLGVGAKVTDLVRRIEYPTLARMAVAGKLKREMTAEELRILYVAMTRAKEKLIIVASFTDAGRELLKLSKDAAAPVPPQVLENVNCLAGLILLPVLTRPEAGCLRGDGTAAPSGADSWDIRRVDADTIQGVSRRSKQPEPASVKASPEVLEELRQRLGYRYPYPAAASIPSKLTATELKGRYSDFEAAEEAEMPDYAKKRTTAARPGFITMQAALTPAERGTALHLAMQYIDYGKCRSPEGILSELRRLREKNFLSAQQADAVDAGKIGAFFASQLGRRILRAEKLYREFKFSLLVPAGEFYRDGAYADGDEILLQGVVDCCFLENGALHIVDFKTDYVTEETLGEKTRLYAPQLNAYGRAMERILGLPVKSRLLYFFTLGAVSEVL
ncbi:MAG: hypothetical protein GX936_06295 [Clostridiales bacterium]|nr:hypothetical protein [Clostridiales bacterium]